MSQVFKAGDRLVLDLADPDASRSASGFNMQLMTPLLLGLLSPFIIASYVAPEALDHVRWLVWAFLVVMFLVCSALFFYTHHFPGQISGLVVDREARTIEVVWRNALTTASQLVPFEDISALRVRYDFDAEGNSRPVAELVVRSRPAMVLPGDISEEKLRPLRAAIGLG